MAKDPAFLFYYQDFLVGTEFMTPEEVGIYIRILCHMADKGSLSARHMQSICRGYAFSDIIKEKFKINENGDYYNERLCNEVEKRRNYAESRRKNASTCKAYAKHMENENVNESKDVSKKEYSKEFLEFMKDYPNQVDKSRAYKAWKQKVKAQDLPEIVTAKANYLAHLAANTWKRAKSAAVFINGWRDWLNFKEPDQPNDQGVNRADLDKIISSKLGRMATDDMIMELMKEIPEKMWWKIDAFLRDRYKNSRGISHLEAKIKRNKDQVNGLVAGCV